MTTFKWHRENLSSTQYCKNMEIPETDQEKKSFEIIIYDVDKNTEHKTISIPVELLDGLQGSKHLTAYTVASDIRKFEIGLFWQRAAFFWAFIVAIYTAYYHILTTIYKSEAASCAHYGHGHFPLLVLAALGLFFCFSWLLSSKGARHWQENWENHLDLLEDNITGPLYKTYRTGSFSESKIVISAGWLVTACSYSLLIYEFASIILFKSGFGKGLFAIIVTVAFAIIIAVCLFLYSVIVTGNTAGNGDFEFQRKVYED